MIDIDWSKCPQATHFAPKPEADDMWCDVFWRVVDGVGVEAWALVSGGLEHYSRPTWRKETAERLIARPPQWNGEGLPPVGIVCEHQVFGCASWTKAIVLAYGERKTFYRDQDGHEWSRLSDEIKFRPLRAEQALGDNLEKDAEALFGFVNPNGKWRKADTEYKDRFRNAVRAGYRKQVQP